MPANAIWPSESWPAQPVSTVSDSAQIAKPAIDAVEERGATVGDDNGSRTASAERGEQHDAVEVTDPEHLPQPLRDRLEPSA